MRFSWEYIKEENLEKEPLGLWNWRPTSLVLQRVYVLQPGRNRSFDSLTVEGSMVVVER